MQLFDCMSNILTSMELFKNEPSFMETICKSFGVDNKQYCSSWFSQANDNCYDMLYPMERKATLWDMLQEILFDGQNFGLYDPNFMNGLPSTYLSSIDCANLYKNITMDYVKNVVPRNNRLVLQLWFMFYVIVAFFSSYFIYNICTLLKYIASKFGKRRKVRNFKATEIREVETNNIKNVANIFNRRTLELMKYETKHLSLKTEVTADSFCCPNHNNLVLRVSEKVDFVKSIVYGHNETIGRFYNWPDLGVENGKRAVYTSTTTVNKVLQYINKFDRRPLQLWIVFDDNEDDITETVDTLHCEANSLRIKNENQKELCNKPNNIQTKLPILPKVSQKLIQTYCKSGSAHDLNTRGSMNGLGINERPSKKIIEDERQSRLKQRSSENCIRATKYGQTNMRFGKKVF